MNLRCCLLFARACLLVTLILLMGGCAWVPQEARLRIDVDMAVSDAGRGVRVAVKVHDRRPETALGHRGIDSEHATITTSQNLVVLFRDAIIDGVARKGFKAVDYDGETPLVLSVEIRRVRYTTDMVFWKGIVKTEAWLVASATKGGARFEQNYTGKREITSVEAPRAKTNERLLNEAISESVQSLVGDPILIRFLVE